VEREAKLRTEIKETSKRREHLQNKRGHDSLPLVALVGYTNAGKTALTNLCSNSELESEDLLFQTLNTTVRKFIMKQGHIGLMLDTVGFITALPHNLVESFKATLEEIHYADVLVHVRDISHP